MNKPDLTRIPDWYHGYISKVIENDLLSAMKNQTPLFISFLKSIPEEKRSFRYADGKWSIAEVLLHITDAERIFAYRALCFARKETNSLPGFDENSYAQHSKADDRNWNEMIEEFRLVRQSNEIMFESFNEEQLQTNGIANSNPVYVLGIGFIMVGHVTHHTDIIKERYF